MSRLFISLFVLTFGIDLFAQDSNPDPKRNPDAWIIESVTIVDVVTGTLRPDRWVEIEDGVIRRIARERSYARGRRVIDGEGLFLVPGFIDSHVHYTTNADTYGPLLIANGVTSARDLGAATENILAIRDEIIRGERLGPDLTVVGAIIDGNPPVWPFSEVCETPEQGRAAVRKLASAGVDQLKVYNRLRPQVHRAVCAEAKVIGLPVTGHVPTSMTVDEVVAAGQRCIEHLTGFGRASAWLATGKVPPRLPWNDLPLWAKLSEADPERIAAWLKKLAAADVFQCPTLVVMNGIGRLASDSPNDPRLDLVPEPVKMFWRSGDYESWAPRMAAALPPMKTMVKAMHEAGVPLVIGTDLANPNVVAGFSLHDEMAMFADAGVPAIDVLRAATSRAARLCGRTDEIGTVATGKVASLVLLRKNPLDDIRHTREIEGVFLRGRWFDRTALDALVEGVRRDVKGAVASTEKVDMTLPGEAFARGTYRQTMGGRDAGSETFVIVRDGDRFRLKADAQPKGGFINPFVMTFDATSGHRFDKAIYERRSKQPLVARYSIVDGREIVGRMTKGDADAVEARLEWTDTSVLSPPLHSIDFFLLRRLALSVGETKTVRAVSVGFPDWKPAAADRTVERLADEKTTRGDRTITVRVYSAKLRTAFGPMTTRIVTDERSVVLETTTSMPFGKMVVTLED